MKRNAVQQTSKPVSMMAQAYRDEAALFRAAEKESAARRMEQAADRMERMEQAMRGKHGH